MSDNNKKTPQQKPEPRPQNKPQPATERRDYGQKRPMNEGTGPRGPQKKQ